MARRIIWWGHSATLATGFATVARNVLAGLVMKYPGEYEIFQLGVGQHPYAGYDRKIHPFEITAPAGANDTVALEMYCEMIKPDMVIMNHDIWITDFVTKPDFMPNRDFPIVFYQPLDGKTVSGGVPRAWRDVLMKQDYTIAYAGWARDAILQTCPEIADRLYVIPHGVDTTLYRPLENNEKPEDLIVVGMVAMNQYRKDHPMFLRAMSKVVKEIPNVKVYLHCNSKSEMGYDLHQLIADYGLQDHTIDVATDGVPISEGGAVPLYEMPEIYNMLDVHVLSTTGEGFGLPHAEAMACGVPALSVDYTTLHDLMPFEWQKIGATDYRPSHIIPLQRALIDPDDMADKIINLCKMTRAERKALGMQCREFIDANYNWKDIIPIWHKTIGEIFDRHEAKKLAAVPQDIINDVARLAENEES